jgi:DNA invertase Pin-like site-specific DNA recombinase
VFGRLAGYEDVNDADRLGRDPAMRWIVGGRAATKQAASTSQMGRFETDWLANNENLVALADLGGRWIDRVHSRRPLNGIVLDMDSSVSRAEKRSGTTTNGRAELQTVLDFLRKGDVLMVTRIDRLARNIGDLQDIVRTLKAKGAALKATEQPIDTSTAAGKAFLDMLGVFAEFETNLRHERQLEGIAKAKAAGVYKGRKPSIDPAKVMRLKADGLGASEIAKRLKIGRASVYRVLDPVNDAAGA